MKSIECFLLEAYVRSYGLPCSCTPCKMGIYALVFSKHLAPWSKMYIFKDIKEAKQKLDLDIENNQREEHNRCRKFKSAGYYLKYEADKLLRLEASKRRLERRVTLVEVMNKRKLNEEVN